MKNMRLLIFVILAALFGCGRLERDDYAPALDRLYLQSDISGLYAIGTGLSGRNLAISHIFSNRFAITAQEYGDIGMYRRYSSYGTLINGMILLDEKITLARFDEEGESVETLYVVNHGGLPSITTDQFFRRISDDSSNVYERQTKDAK